MLAPTSGFPVNRIAGNLRYPLFGWMLRDACEGDTPGLELPEEKNVVRDQAAPGQHLRREEVGSSQPVHMPADPPDPPGRR